MASDQPSSKTVTDAIRLEARRRPGGWVYVIDPYFDSNDRVPPHGIEGAWKVDNQGEVTGEFHHNPNYKPSPRTLGMPTPLDAVETALQLAATGYGTDDMVNRALMESTVLIQASTQDHITIFTDADGSYINIFTNTERATESDHAEFSIDFRSLSNTLPNDISVRINPGNAVTARVPIDRIRSLSEAIDHDDGES
ncbi:type VII secretion system-associated protein [Nocardia fluminea]|uniref:type VII secretion system-associated protein n=1 Tax=Nocardia fluminea TaxID=134984 RepID=UPI003829E12D